ncbi:MAG: apolipoprotein N-acyltransferase, partial [Gemmatimonadales bacterium]
LDSARRLFLVSVGVLGALTYGAWRMRTLPVRPAGVVAVTQPSIGFQEKWDAVLQEQIFDSVVSISREALAHPGVQLVVWPEASMPGSFLHRPSWERVIGAQAAQAGVPVVVGGLDYARTGDQPGDYEYWNAAFVFDADGQRQGRPYHKRYLVPITERVPFVNPRLFNLQFFGAFSIGRDAPVFTSPVGGLGILICYESLFPELAADYRRRGADVLLNITNDAWFGNTSAPPGHLAHMVMRAIETRTGVARAANTGISGFVDPFGRITARSALGDRTTLATTVMTTDVIPLAVRWGDWVGLLSLVATALLLGAAAWRRR